MVLADGRLLWFAACALVLTSACGKTMTEGECKRVGTHLREVWDGDVAASAPNEAQGQSERARNAIKSEGDKMEAEWLSTCRRDLEGRAVDEKELECIMAADTVGEVHDCAAAKK